jgi:hypothetical protein
MAARLGRGGQAAEHRSTGPCIQHRRWRAWLVPGCVGDPVNRVGWHGRHSTLSGPGCGRPRFGLARSTARR